ncbi:hypothetical protein VE01_10579 [Pseudogymnoascus verrucosus]|uniref:Uncharacterized protein n=1 Tax=Pseudogymnoascus verrucosus TaxID=342668 RepID=A0A1B8G6M4_9PEZI|nr:uncharacterized protein VE01_10579 [Pseudogymnoascus verrucosus]OBT91489.1 hypothetical protein VE01_10579 [Pseudogymnoascus verrucosus]
MGLGIITESQPVKMKRNNIVVFSGGSAANTLVDVFGNVAREKGCTLSYIIPISDNGGSSSELIRVLGGPGIGDVRSRLVRLIPEDVAGNDPEKAAMKTFFNHRLASTPEAARAEWLDIVEARHELWTSISSEKEELIRSFLNTINLEIVKRARPSSFFNFQSAAVGNLFLTGARLFTGSFESAIYLLGSITGVPSNVSVIPTINSNFSHHICAGLRDGTSIVGQNSISHPSPLPNNLPGGEDDIDGPMSPTTFQRKTFEELIMHDSVEDANLPGSLPTLRKQYIDFHKSDTEDLPSRIRRIWYINPYGQEIRPSPNPKALAALGNSQAVIYSIGSLYTSIIPCLILKDVGNAIAAPGIKSKILILNGSIDRETGPETNPYCARDFICAISNACGTSRGDLSVDAAYMNKYVTHVIHLEGEGTPKVDKEELKSLGIETFRVYGRKNPEGGMLYDGKALTQALESILGREDKGVARRNTLQH